MTSLKLKVLDKVIHDIRGPLSNLTGFSIELEVSIGQLVTTINRFQDQLPDDFKNIVDVIIENDIKPCLGFSSSSVSKIVRELDEIEKSIDCSDTHG